MCSHLMTSLESSYTTYGIFTHTTSPQNAEPVEPICSMVRLIYVASATDSLSLLIDVLQDKGSTCLTWYSNALSHWLHTFQLLGMHAMVSTCNTFPRKKSPCMWGCMVDFHHKTTHQLLVARFLLNPKVPLWVSLTVNSFEFLPCDSTPQVECLCISLC